MEIRKASRRAVKLRIGFSGTSGSGKTLSALRVAYGLIGNWDKIGVLDTEGGSGELYTDQTFSDGFGGTFYIGAYNYINLTNYSPEKYIEAITAFEKAGVELIITDSITHSWEFILAVQASMTGNSYVNWGVVKPRFARLKTKILQSPCHMFTTVRRKQDYEMIKGSDGKAKVQKLGLKEVVEDGWEYELTVNFEIEQNHLCQTSKDRTSMFNSVDPFMLTEATGEQLLKWCTSGSADSETLLQIAQVEINNASSPSDLNGIYLKFPGLHKSEDFLTLLKTKKAEYQAQSVPA